MDEATASVDMETDQIIQEVVNKYFGDRTILIIAVSSVSFFFGILNSSTSGTQTLGQFLQDFVFILASRSFS